MITIIWRPGDMYYGINGEVRTPIRHYSGYIDEDRELEKWYREQLNEYEQTLSSATYLNKVLAKKALDKQVKDWVQKLKYGNWSETVFHLDDVAIGDLTKQTIAV